MRNRKIQIALATLLVVLGAAAYLGGQHWYRAYHAGAAAAALDRRDLRTARVHLHKCLNSGSRDPALRLLTARTARRLGDFTAAAAQLGTYEQQQGRDADFELETQLLEVQQGQSTQADALLATCRAHPETTAMPLILEAVIEGSLRIVRQATAGGPIDTDRLAPDMARVRRAVDLWLEHCPGPADQAQGLLWRGLLQKAAGDEAGATAALRQALELNPDNFDIRLNMAVAVAYANPEEALVHLQWLRERYPEDPQFYFTLAVVHRMLGQFTEAGQLLDQLLAANPFDVSVLVERGYVAMNAGQLEDGEQYLRRAYHLAPEAPSVNLAMSGYLNLAGRPAEAKEFFDRGKALDDAHNEKLRLLNRPNKSASP